MKITAHPKYSALGLIEVLIVLGIIGTAVIGISQLAVTSFLDIRDDELGEYAAGVMIQGLELSKSASGIPIDQHPTPNNPLGSYSVISDGSGYSLQFEQLTTDLITTCPENSAYLVSINTVTNPNLTTATPLVCAQIVVKANSTLDQTGFEIVSNSVYVVRNTTYQQTAKSYRYLSIASPNPAGTQIN
jgi:hypothetical protein